MSIWKHVVAEASASGVSMKVGDNIRVPIFENTIEVDVGQKRWIQDVRHYISNFELMIGDRRSVSRNIVSDAFAPSIVRRVHEKGSSRSSRLWPRKALSHHGLRPQPHVGFITFVSTTRASHRALRCGPVNGDYKHKIINQIGGAWVLAPGLLLVFGILFCVFVGW